MWVTLTLLSQNLRNRHTFLYILHWKWKNTENCCRLLMQRPSSFGNSSFSITPSLLILWHCLAPDLRLWDGPSPTHRVSASTSSHLTSIVWHCLDDSGPSPGLIWVTLRKRIIKTWYFPGIKPESDFTSLNSLKKRIIIPNSHAEGQVQLGPRVTLCFHLSLKFSSAFVLRIGDGQCYMWAETLKSASTHCIVNYTVKVQCLLFIRFLSLFIYFPSYFLCFFCY